MSARADVALGVAPVLSLAMHDPEGSLRKILRGLMNQAARHLWFSQPDFHQSIGGDLP